MHQTVFDRVRVHMYIVGNISGEEEIYPMRAPTTVIYYYAKY